MRTLVLPASFVAAVLIGCAASRATAPPQPLQPEPVLPAAVSVSLPQVGLMPEWMDRSADPCRDFYQFSCGGFDAKTEIPADLAAWGTTEIVEKRNEEILRDLLQQAGSAKQPTPLEGKLGSWYQACMDEPAIEARGLSPVQPLLKTIASVKDTASLDAAVMELHAHQVWPLFDIAAQQDFADATKMIAGLDQDGLGMPDRDYYLQDDGNRKEVREFYRGHVTRILTLGGLSAREAKEGTEDVMRIETALARLAQDKVTRRDPHAIYHKIDRAGVAGAAKTFPWDAYYQHLGFPGIQEISVNSVEYFAGMDALRSHEPPRAWRHYLTWQLLHAMGRRLGKAFVEESFAWQKKLTGQAELEPRWKRCVRSTDGALGELLGQLYVEKAFPGESKKDADDLVQGIRASMNAELSGLAWMDPKTRDAALAKLGKMAWKIGYPARWKTYDYEVSRDDYPGNAIRSEAFELKRQLGRIGKPVDRELWDMTPPTVNAYYDPSMNQMVFPAGILQPPFFSKDFPLAVNAGATGGAMGHELTHGFDDEGSQFDGDGNLRQWWEGDTEKKFQEQGTCVVDQYSAYEPLPGQHLNGKLTEGENIADIGGLKLAFNAYRKGRDRAPLFTAEGFDEDQVFFLAYAQSWCEKLRPEMLELQTKNDPHSPARYRVNGPVSDAPAFAEVFHCSAGSPLKPAKVCQVW